MKAYVLPVLMLALSSCRDDNGNFETGNTLLLIGSILLVLYSLVENAKKEMSEKKEKEKAAEDFESYFVQKLNQNSFISSNIVCSGLVGALAVSDKKDCIAIMNEARIFKIIPAKNIVKSELIINNDTKLESVSKAPIVTWNTVAKTKSTMKNQFANATLKISIDDIESPLFKFTFSDPELADKYYALLNVVINNK
ncbi:MAG TPA: hypothetical protein PLS87_11210 [Ferruginibacter sp.]|nr:hypothetical protein [Ferruginibacter sp.]HRP50451.1 hypothetical protein [Ferruginibacter sp.]